MGVSPAILPQSIQTALNPYPFFTSRCQGWPMVRLPYEPELHNSRTLLLHRLGCWQEVGVGEVCEAVGEEFGHVGDDLG